jgi:hypothetical protein
MKSRMVIRLFGIALCAQFLLALIAFVATRHGDGRVHAILGMGLGLLVLWVAIGGLLMRRFREPIRRVLRALPLPWWLKFVGSCTALALIEEAVTTTMTNLAPLFGSRVGVAFITESADYWDVVLGHSVIAFVPMFIGWAVLLARYDFSPNQVFLLYGLLGTLAETLFSGPQQLLGVGMWVYVYGLMVYLPAYSLPPRSNLRPPRAVTYPLAFVVPLLTDVVFLLFAVPIIHALRPSTLNSFLHPRAR